MISPLVVLIADAEQQSQRQHLNALVEVLKAKGPLPVALLATPQPIELPKLAVRRLVPTRSGLQVVGEALSLLSDDQLVHDSRLLA
jgi:hypothetical protein